MLGEEVRSRNLTKNTMYSLLNKQISCALSVKMVHQIPFQILITLAQDLVNTSSTSEIRTCKELSNI